MNLIAKELLEGDTTCVLTNGRQVYTSTQRGVRPLLDFLDSGMSFSGFDAADKVVGKATALLYCLLDVRCVHALVISESALEVLESHGITVTWEQKVSQIRNRNNTGRCPMELATQHIHDPALALTAIRSKLRELGQ